MMWMLVSSALAASVQLSPGDDVATRTAALQPGDEVVFSAGTYSLAGPVTWAGLGTASAPIVIRGDGDVVLELQAGWVVVYMTASTFVEIRNLTFRGGAGNSEGYTGLYIDNSSDITIEDVEVGPVSGTALVLSGNNARIHVSRAHLHDTTDGNGVYAGCSDASCWTEDSTFSNLWIHDIGGESNGFELEPGCQGVTLADSVVYRATAWGIVTDSAEYGERNTVEGNAVWETTSGGIYSRGSALIRNNLVFNSAGVGMRLSDGDRGTAQDTVVSFNTIADTTGSAVEIHDWAGYTGMVFANNVIANPTGRALYFNEVGYDDATLLTHNVVTGLVDGLSDTYAGAPDPVWDGGGYHDFVDVEGWDFYPIGGASMVDAADPAAATYVPELDFNGAPRDGEKPDAGAYEWDGGSNPGWALQEGFKDLEAYGASNDDVQGGCCEDKEPGGGEAALIGLAGLGWALRRGRVRSRARALSREPGIR
ncbi:MAG: right-handed parallel beta-helix repeat-containing protein [Pseudomonadota bacterium]|nr:right-handed parallel beta-helix repeat-containing protein [Pseudomonadota bacterium]